MDRAGSTGRLTPHNDYPKESGSLWQRGFYDYVLDSQEKLLTKIKYIEQNPVKGGLVSKPELYRYSSTHSQNATDLDIYLDGNVAGQECPAYSVGG